MLKKIIIPVLLISFIFIPAAQINAQQKSFERKAHKQAEKKVDQSIHNCTQMSKCIEKIAADSELRNVMLQKLNDEFDKATSVPIGLENIPGKPLQLNKSKSDKENNEGHIFQLFNKLPYKRR